MNRSVMILAPAAMIKFWVDPEPFQLPRILPETVNGPAIVKVPPWRFKFPLTLVVPDKVTEAPPFFDND